MATAGLDRLGSVLALISANHVGRSKPEPPEPQRFRNRKS